MNPPRNKLIIALDVETPNEARRLVSSLRGVAGMFKVGSQLFSSGGPEVVREIINSGEQVFLDLKFHDIPNTVAAAAVQAMRLGVSMFNVHASGGSIMMRRTAEAIKECGERERIAPPVVLGVTVLTSSDKTTLAEIGWTEQPDQLVTRLAQLAANSGLDGVVASAREVSILRKAVSRSPFVIVTPGIRPACTSKDDQSRVMTPREAIDAGADYIVVGRPILQAPDPVQAARQVIAEMQTSLAANKF